MFALKNMKLIKIVLQYFDKMEVIFYATRKQI